MRERRPRRASARGSITVEFALISLILYVLVAATLDLGRLVFVAQGVQEAARVAARELAAVPLPAESTFEEALLDAAVCARVFNPDLLVIDLDAFATQADQDAFLDALPAVNQALRPLMIAEQIDDGGTRRNLLRYPGALLDAQLGGACGLRQAPFAVGIPRVVSRDADTGVETISWVPILEEIRSDPATPSTGTFSLASADPRRGLVGVRINYPFQAGALTGYRANPAQVPGGPPEPNLADPIEADDASVVAPAPPIGSLRGAVVEAGVYGGPYGLGVQQAWGKRVRPYRSLIAAQALHRREVFQ